MKGIFGIVIGVFVSLLVCVAPVSAQSVSTETITTYVDVYHDANTNGAWDSDESALAWNVRALDMDFVELGSDVALEGAPAQIVTNEMPRYICSDTSMDWILTQPSSGVFHPDNLAWYCYDLLEVESEVYVFGVATEQTPEPAGELIDEGNTPATEKDQIEEDAGAVLGASTDPAVLAETGSPIWVSPLVGIVLIALAIRLARNRIIE